MNMPAFLTGATLATVVGLLLLPTLTAHGQVRQRPLPEKIAPKVAATAAPQSPAKAVPNAGVQPAGKLPVEQPDAAQQQTADEQAIREAGAAFMKAYGAADAKAVAAHFSAEAEYVDEQGTVFQGRSAIEESLAAFFAENPGCQLEMTIDTLRFVSPGVAIEDGTTIVTRAGDPHPIETRYTTVHVKTDGKWLAASVRDQAPKDRRQHRTQLEQLDWLIGDWVDEGDDALVTFSCQAVDGGNFLLRKFSIQIAGQEALSGTQRIGFDPLTGKLRTWIFDSEGGYGEGLWHRNGDDWVLKLTGVTADGEPASSTSIYTLVNGHTMTWQSVGHEIAGVQIPDSEVVTVVRSAPKPELTELTETP
jgi:uncharacterized protein (TIGR02246 family)